ncbi:MAG: hypothetical protein AABX16_01020 [Nanoarchaeota archaeon]
MIQVAANEFQDSISSLLSEFATRLNEVEEKQRLLRDRTMLVGENMIDMRQDQEKEEFEMKKKVNELDFEIKTIKQTMQKIINELSNVARKSEVEIIKRQLEIFQPLELARIKDIDAILDAKLKSKKETFRQKIIQGKTVGGNN